MKLISAAGLLALARVSYAFPTADIAEAMEASPEMMKRAEEILEKHKRQDTSSADDAAKIFEPVPIWNANQEIKVGSGSGHQWVAPGPNDQRGPCPGLNAFANHGFLPHNGYATISQFIDATMNTVGMGFGLASFLAVYGAVIDGSGTAWSIGGTPLTQGKAGGNGISNSHNKYESDVSPTRPDLYQYGNDYKLRVKQYRVLSDLGSLYDIPTLTKFRSIRFDTQKAQNPLFFNGPFTGVLVQPAAFTFIYRFMANHTKQNPEGILNHNVFESWFSITGSPGSYKWTPGHERIPNNWYRRPALYPYDQSYFIADVKNAAAIYPKFLDVGGNTGTPGKFTGVDIGDLNGGIINGQNLLSGNNFACLAYQFAANAKPDLVLNSNSVMLQNVISNVQGTLACPELEDIDSSQLHQFPGYTKAGSPFG